MKKMKKKLLVTAAIFTAALNMNGCGAYGPEPDDDMYAMYPQMTKTQEAVADKTNSEILGEFREYVSEINNDTL